MKQFSVLFSIFFLFLITTDARRSFFQKLKEPFTGGVNRLMNFGKSRNSSDDNDDDEDDDYENEEEEDENENTDDEDDDDEDDDDESFNYLKKKKYFKTNKKILKKGKSHPMKTHGKVDSHKISHPNKKFSKRSNKGKKKHMKQTKRKYHTKNVSHSKKGKHKKKSKHFSKIKKKSLFTEKFYKEPKGVCMPICETEDCGEIRNSREIPYKKCNGCVIKETSCHKGASDYYQCHTLCTDSECSSLYDDNKNARDLCGACDDIDDIKCNKGSKDIDNPQNIKGKILNKIFRN